MASEGIGLEAETTLYLGFNSQSTTLSENGPTTTSNQIVTEVSPTVAYFLSDAVAAGGGLLFSHVGSTSETSSGNVTGSTTDTSSTELGVFGLIGYHYPLSGFLEAHGRALAGYSRAGTSAGVPGDGDITDVEVTRHNLLLGLEAGVHADIQPWLFATVSARYLFRHAFSVDGSSRLPSDSSSSSHMLMLGVGAGARF
ncbi:outer membrane beta-barrel protein [Myxococcota bacterium]